MSYPGCKPYRRTPAQRADQRLAWERPDEAFFAAGACHILAWTFQEIYPESGHEIFALRSKGGQVPWHVYVSDGTWAFDFAGWTREDELLAVTREQSGDIEPVLVTSDLTTFCENNDHRRPDQFWADPRPRAREYLTRFDGPGSLPGGG
ncbi:hypothetical protein [Actinopolymorpha pittospori]